MENIDKATNKDDLWNKKGKYPKIDLVGHSFGRLIILSWEGRNRWRRNMWLCQCECGGQKIIDQQCLKSGDTQSCGCLQEDSGMKHGYATKTKGIHPLYRVLAGMKRRCYNKDDIYYKHYGGRGITICDEWVESPGVFIDWGLQNGYEEGLSIERIDNDGNYSPENCCFASCFVQNNNKRSNILLTYNGKTQNMAQWAKKVGLKYNTLYARIQYGWTIEDALFKPIDIRKQKKEKNE